MATHAPLKPDQEQLARLAFHRVNQAREFARSEPGDICDASCNMEWREYGGTQEDFLFVLEKARAMRERMRIRVKRKATETSASLPRLSLLAIRMLGKGCLFCDTPLTPANVAFVEDDVASTFAIDNDPFHLTNVLVCCELCKSAKGWLRAPMFRDVVEAFIQFDTAGRFMRDYRKESLDILAKGYKVIHEWEHENKKRLSRRPTLRFRLAMVAGRNCVVSELLIREGKRYREETQLDVPLDWDAVPVEN